MEVEGPCHELLDTFHMWVKLLTYQEDNDDFRLSIHSGDIGIKCKNDWSGHFTMFIMRLICLAVLYKYCLGYYSSNVGFPWNKSEKCMLCET